jgi:hypothetical protein
MTGSTSSAINITFSSFILYLSFKILYTQLQPMERADVEKYIKEGHIDTAILRKPSVNALKQFPDTVAIVSYSVETGNVNTPFGIVHMPLLAGKAEHVAHGNQDNFYTEDLQVPPGPKIPFGPHITKIIGAIPSAGGKRRKRNTYKKRNGRRRKTQYRRR